MSRGAITYHGIDFEPILIAAIVFLRRENLFTSFTPKPYNKTHERLSRHLWDKGGDYCLSISPENIIFDLVGDVSRSSSYKAWRDTLPSRDYCNGDGVEAAFMVTCTPHARWPEYKDEYVKSMALTLHGSTLNSFKLSEVQTFVEERLLRKHLSVSNALASAAA